MTNNQSALDALYDTDSQNFAQNVADELVATLNAWHAQPEKWDAALDSQIHAWYVNPPKVFPKKPYFSPSATGACKRELYEKGIGSKRDAGGQQPHQKRWTAVGTAIGDMIQRDLLFIEKHMEGARFRFERNADGTPMFEDFAKRNVPINCGGIAYHLFGAPDGILIYTDENGEQHRIGLEIKSKQTTAARTSHYSLRQADEKHELQTIAYSIMYGVSHYIVLYVNTAHKSWSMTEEEFANTPDIRAFGVDCTNERKAQLIEELAEIQRMINEGQAPLPDLSKWTFNGFKDAIATSITDEELAQLEAQVASAKRSGLKDFAKRAYIDGLADLKQRRKN